MIRIPETIRVIEADDIRLTEKRDQIYVKKSSDFLWYLMKYNAEVLLKFDNFYYVFEDTDTAIIFDDSGDSGK